MNHTSFFSFSGSWLYVYEFGLTKVDENFEDISIGGKCRLDPVTTCFERDLCECPASSLHEPETLQQEDLILFLPLNVGMMDVSQSAVCLELTSYLVKKLLTNMFHFFRIWHMVKTLFRDA